MNSKMEEDLCFACVHCDFMTFNPSNLEHHFSLRHKDMPPKSVLKHMPEPMHTIIKQMDELLSKSRHISSHLPIENDAEELSRSSKVNSKRREMTQISSEPIHEYNFRAVVNNEESKPTPMKLFKSSPVADSHSTIRQATPYEDKRKAESPEVILVSSDLDLLVSGNDDIEVDIAGKPFLSDDMLFTAETRTDERNGNTREGTIIEHKESGSKNGQIHFHSEAVNWPETSGCAWKSESKAKRDNFLPKESSIVPLSWPCTENPIKDSTLIRSHHEPARTEETEVKKDLHDEEPISVKMDHTSERHINALQDLCRVCAQKALTERCKKNYHKKKPCKQHEQDIFLVFALCIKEDDADRHSEYICHKCLAKIRYVKQRRSTSSLENAKKLCDDVRRVWVPFRPELTVEECELCSHHVSVRLGCIKY